MTEDCLNGFTALSLFTAALDLQGATLLPPLLVRSTFSTLLGLVALLCAQTAYLGADQPNIVWLSTEDIGAHFGCYGDPHAITPHIDQLAAEGTLYSRAYTTAGVCAPSRSAVITGVFQSSLGSQHMRSQVRLPDGLELFPTYLREAGYYTTNNSKTDYQLVKNLPAEERAWNDSSPTAHWRNRPDADQPFFAVFNFQGTHESRIAGEDRYHKVTANLTPEERQDPAALTTLPPYYPDTPTNRENWKRNYELITAMDHWAADVIQQLKDDGLYENTIIFFWSDHGIGLPRAKRWLYESGTRIPLIVRAPQHLQLGGLREPGSVDGQLVSAIDFAPTMLNIIGRELPDHFQGRAFLGNDLSPTRDYIYGARDRMDERYDIIRTVRDTRFRYVRNYEPLKPYYQFMNSAENGPTMAELRQLHDAGKLDPVADRYFGLKPPEELYDVSEHPHEIHNLADDPAYAHVLARMRQAHLDWVDTTRDTGLLPESLLARLGDEIGSRYEILRQSDNDAFPRQLARAANLASSGPDALDELIAAMNDPHPAIRYWAATGLGNIGAPEARSGRNALRTSLTDEERVVRVAAARRLCRLGEPTDALPVLVEVLANGAQWERLHAAIVLDEIDEQARPVIPALHAALVPREELVERGKYVVRVINRALNQLEGTQRAVR
jgi:N-sulfoglucosamine sulfohydrolase